MTAATEFVAIVPARRDSSRLPGKPLADIGGEPMLVLALRRAAMSGAARALAATDDEEIAAVARAAGFECVLTGACASGSERAARAAADCGISDDAIVVNVQGDEPFLEPELPRRTAALLAASPQCVCATAMRPPRGIAELDDPSAVKVLADADGRARYFSRAVIPHGAPPSSARIHIGVYAYRMNFLRRLSSLSPAPAEAAENLEQLRILWHGESIALLDCESESFGVDTPADLEKARARAKTELAQSAAAG